ncbi:hypothetical protein FACS1894216_18610 [Synergistales bacterium]|nr:hypothetical protein FACS1894216_18610 [Synergistales bacterium]
MDSGNLTKQFAPIASAFKGRSLCIVPDDDDAGAKAAEAGAGFGFTALPIPKMGGVRDGARL